LQHLEQAGVPPAQALAIANVIEQRRDQLVTSAEFKTELGSLEARIKSELASLEVRLNDKIGRLWWPVVVIGVITWLLQIFGTSLQRIFHFL
jgi:hypothetical protein